MPGFVPSSLSNPWISQPVISFILLTWVWSENIFTGIWCLSTNETLLFVTRPAGLGIVPYSSLA